ncbi:uncharacterized protein B0H18DRAFT_1127871 [Fomitopsis serialis]|uniref:uncharacterized protein n=1 Tax=Fomitopsis serialis TaxID=139415 RepID=UPI0020081FC5|nr:uncharacterized protein B0H18DRAFT_1127871 [Neoantrodia serialis]KAH9911883.1 hypothetical protein B0H18DRAFT_1127871 [Neoantrodia serialis]
MAGTGEGECRRVNADEAWCAGTGHNEVQNDASEIPHLDLQAGPTPRYLYRTLTQADVDAATAKRGKENTTHIAAVTAENDEASDEAPVTTSSTTYVAAITDLASGATDGTSSIPLDVHAVDGNNGTPGVFTSVPGALVNLSCTNDGPEVHTAKVYPVRTSPAAAPMSEGNTTNDELVACLSNFTNGVLGLCSSTRSVLAAPNSRDGVSGEPPSSTRPPL